MTARVPRAPGGWSGLIINQTSVPALSKVLLGTFVPSGAFGVTVRRIRATVMWSSDQVAVTENPLGAIGFAVFDDTAVAVGIGSLSDPVTDIQDDIWTAYQGLVARVSVATSIGVNEPAGEVFHIDSKAMRKVPVGKTLAMIVGNARPAEDARISVVVRIYSTFSR